MMTPEDVLIEAISAAALHGDTVPLRELACWKLAESMKLSGVLHVTDALSHETDDQEIGPHDQEP